MIEQDQKIAKQQKKIKNAFDLFDKEQKGVVDIREVGTIIRSLGFAPSERELRQYFTEIEEEEPTGYVRYDRFEKLLLRMFREHACPCSDEETIIKAFRALDPQRKGAIEPDDLRFVLTNNGEPLLPEEIEDMLGVAVDAQSNLVYYEDYATLLCADQ